MSTPERKPYDLTALNPDELDKLLDLRPDLRKEIMAEANRRHLAFAQDAMTNEGG